MHHGGGAMTKIVFTVLLVMAFACDVFAFAGRVPYSMVEQVDPVNLPDVMLCQDGSRVKNVEQWETRRRPELLDFFTRNVYGIRPVERPDDIRFTPVAPEIVFPGNIRRKQVRVEFSGPLKKWSFEILAFLPESAKPVPSFVLICNESRESHMDPELRNDSDFWPVRAIVKRGYAAVAFKTTQLASDQYYPYFENGEAKLQDPDFTNDVYSCFAPRREYRSWSAISAWAWGASRVLDWIETDSAFDAAKVAVIGHSRAGKTALWAAASDSRFAMACVNDSGCCGAKLNHAAVCMSETIALDNAVNPHWFCRAYRQFNGKDHVLPYDQHWIAALIAPRLLYIASGSQDIHAGPWGEFLTARHASPAWELYGKKGLVEDGAYKIETPFHAGRVGYHLRNGKHALAPYDWHRYMDFADRHMR
jgi:hypothetical protein